MHQHSQLYESEKFNQLSKPKKPWKQLFQEIWGVQKRDRQKGRKATVEPSRLAENGKNQQKIKQSQHLQTAVEHEKGEWKEERKGAQHQQNPEKVQKDSQVLILSS